MRDVADAVHLSPSYFGKLFKQETGQAFSVFLMEFRIQKSKALIRAEDMRLADVAFAVGFEDQSYFTKVFKRVAGVSPMQYRTKMGDE